MIEVTEKVILPIGIDVDGVRYREVIIDEMNGIDEENLSSRKLQNNGGKAITVLLRRCIQQITGLVDKKDNKMSLISEDIVRNMYIADRDYLVVCIKTLSNTSEIFTELKCGSCDGDLEHIIDFKDMDVYEWDEDLDAYLEIELPRGFYDNENDRYCNIVKWKFPTGKVQEAMSSTEPSKLSTMMISSGIIEVKDLGYVPSFEQVRRLSLSDRNVFANAILDNSVGVETKVEIECRFCGHINESEVDLVGFTSSARAKQKTAMKNGKRGRKLRKKQ